MWNLLDSNGLVWGECKEGTSIIGPWEVMAECAQPEFYFLLVKQTFKSAHGLPEKMSLILKCVNAKAKQQDVIDS